MTGLLGQSIWCRNHVSILPREAMRKLSEMFDVIPSRSKSVFIVCVHPTITIREHLLDRFTEVRKTFQGKIIISIGCLHSFQELLYIVLTLEGYFVVTGAT